MKVLVACEYSGIVRDAFLEKGHDAWSCDLRPSEKGNPHLQTDIFRALKVADWDLMIAHPPCTYLSNSGVRWLYEKQGRWKDMIKGAVFFRKLLNADVPKIAVENPIMHKWAKKVIGKNQDQVIQPYQFGHAETKATCLWLKNLPKLKPTNLVDPEKVKHRVHEMAPSDDRSKERSRFFEGIAESMADQWSGLYG